ncbi:uncharacterized protein UTRI_03501 [Ustilago trichophora]|uniref:Uncharacterized protein n=1 Tax=Ustilago trichophora TaxID=86804 RepID=A0A5C3E0J5_9BASI|nr:uncharacterized protein UTRI_03501 [Ustilago trichophora]
MPTVERRSLPQSLSAVATKGRRLFSRDLANVSSDCTSRSSTPLRASALNLNEALEQCWSAASSPHCLSNQLRSPQPSVSVHSNSWGKDFGRRRSSNTTTTSTSSATLAQDGSQRRRKSLFSKKARSEQPSAGEDTQKFEGLFVDPFAREVRRDAGGRTSLKPSSEAHASVTDTGPKLTRNRSYQRLSRQQQQKKEALDRVSNLVCLSVEKQMQLPRCQVAASSPTFLSPSPTLCNSYFYPVDAPPSPTSPLGSIDSGVSVVAFPVQPRERTGLRLTMGSDAEGSGEMSSVTSPSLSTSSTGNFHLDGLSAGEDDLDSSQDACWPPVSHAEGILLGHNQILLPSSMKRLPSRMPELDASKRSSASLKADVGHGPEAKSASLARFTSGLQRHNDWFEQSRPSLPPPPPLRPSRNPLRSRSKSLSAATAKATERKDRATSPPPPLPSPPISASMANASELVGPCGLTPVHTPPRSRPSSEYREQGGRCDSWASAASSSSLQGAPFHTPTFGSSRWSSLPVS